MTEEEINEMKQEISEWVDEMFDELYSHVTMKELDAYLVYDEETKTFDLIKQFSKCIGYEIDI